MPHLTHAKRTVIEIGLKNRESFKAIAKKVWQSPSSVSREVLKHRIDGEKGAYGRIRNRCLHRHQCEIMMLCGTKCSRHCSSCAKCNSLCSKFEEEICERLNQPSYVCNGCKDESRCLLRKKYDIHYRAETEYRHILRSSLVGAALTEEKRLSLGKQLEAGSAKGQSVHHIMVSRKDEFTACEKSIYRYINQGLFRQHPGRTELPKAPGMKPRRKKRKTAENRSPRPPRKSIGRLYEFLPCPQ